MTMDKSTAQKEHNLSKLSKEVADKRCEIISDRINHSFHHLRYVIIIFCGLMTGLMLLLRLTISIAIVSMVNRTALHIMEHPNSSIEEFFPEDYIETGEFAWTNEMQQIILSGYMLAYTLPQFYTTRLTLKYGLRSSIPFFLSLCAASSLLTPMVSSLGWHWTVILRMINGIGASPIVACVLKAIENWMPKEDSAKGVALLQFTWNILMSSSPLIAGFLTSIHWSWAFYIPGLATLIFCFIWYNVYTDHPCTSPFISQQELDLIVGVSNEKSIGIKLTSQDNKTNGRPDLPWYFMFKIPQFYPLLIIWSLHCFNSGGFLFLLPTYLKRVLGLPIDQIGLINFSVQIGILFCTLWPGPIINLIQRLFNTSLTNARKVVILICSLSVAATFAYLGLTHENLVTTISLNRFFIASKDTIVTATIMSQYSDEGVSVLVFSMVNTFGNLSTLLFCWTSGKLLDVSGETLECWTWIYAFMTSAILIYGLIYVCFVDSEPIKLKKSIRFLEEGKK